MPNTHLMLVKKHDGFRFTKMDAKRDKYDFMLVLKNAQRSVYQSYI